MFCYRMIFTRCGYYCRYLPTEGNYYCGRVTLGLKHDTQKATAGKHHFENTTQWRKRKTFHAGGTRRVPGSWGMKENSRRRRFHILFDLDPRNLFFSSFCIHRFEVKGTPYENLVTAGRLREATWFEHLFGCEGVPVASK